MAELRPPKLNRVLISGRITFDIEKKLTPKGTAVVRFALAVDKSFKDASGQWQNEAVVVDCIAWEKWADALEQNAHKGSPIVLEGRIEARNYTDKDNNNRKVTEVVADYIQFLEYKPKDASEPELQSTKPEPDNPDMPF
jgi:single-strand DNA-binding protein